MTGSRVKRVTFSGGQVHDVELEVELGVRVRREGEARAVR